MTWCLGDDAARVVTGDSRKAILLSDNVNSFSPSFGGVGEVSV